MPVPPRRKSVRDMLVPSAPRDVTETARQGQGIGDIEAIRQMATTAIPEVLRNAPATSTAMSIFDIAKAAAERDIPGASMAALGILPFARAAKSVGRAVRAARDLPMDEASRMARAAEQGFTRDVYHGTGIPEQFEELRPSKVGMFGPLPYTTTNPASAGEYAISRAKMRETRGTSSAPHIIPLKAKIENPIVVETSGEFWDKFAHLGETDEEIIEALKKQGYDGIIQKRPDEFQEYVMPFESSQLRSRFAKFDPANIGKAGLMGGLAALLTGQREDQP